MTTRCLRFGLGVAFLLALLARAPAQDEKDKGKPDKPAAQEPAKDQPPPEDKGAKAPPGKREPDDYRRFFAKPETVPQFWDAISFELGVGRYDLAAGHLHALLVSRPGDQELVGLEEKVGMAPILKLRNVRTWSDDPKADEQSRADVEELINRVGGAVRNVRGDPKRIRASIDNLTASPEERAYALRDLDKAGATAVPYLIDALREAKGDERAAYLSALGRLGPDTVPPIVAALDSNDAVLKLDLLDVLRGRAARESLRDFVREVVPNLWFLSASPSEVEAVRRRATELLAALTETPASRLPPAKQALTREAERYYRHQVRFADPEHVTVWRWDGQHVVASWPDAPTVTASRAEEYYGLRHADQALRLDPTYAPAQAVLLSLALDKGVERSGLAQPLSRGDPAVHDLLASVNPELVAAVLDRALAERRTPVVLGSVRTLGGLGEGRAGRPGPRGEPALVRALNYPDRRVQMAAAEALLRAPGPTTAAAGGRVVEVLRRALAAEPSAAGKVLVGYFNEDVADRVAQAVRKAGFEAVKAHTGREVMLRAGEAADIDLLLLDAALPDPGLAPLLGQLRADANVGQLPVVLTAPTAEREESLRRYVERYPNVTVVPFGLVVAPKELQDFLRARLGDALSPPLSEAERKDYAERAARHLAALAAGLAPGYDVRPAADTILAVLGSGRLSPEGQAALVAAAERLAGPRAQRELAKAVLDARRPVAVRSAAAQALVRHIQRQGLMLTPTQTAALADLYAQPTTDAALKGDVALLLGSLRPDARVTGERLLRYQPPPPAAAAPAPAPAPKEPEGKDEKPAKEKGQD
jgi:CheY-like chemotaxis protein